MPPKKGPDLLKWFFIAGVVCVLGAAWMIWGENIRVYQRNSEAESTFGAMLPDLYAQGENIIREGGGREKKIDAKGRTGGKALWVNVKNIPRSNRFDHEFKIDPLMGTLPDDQRATKAAEVQTLVLAFPNSMRNHQMQVVHTIEVKGAKFSQGLEYWVEILDCHLIDLKNKRYLGCKTFVWEPESETMAKNNSHIPERKDDELLNWFLSLPVK